MFLRKPKQALKLLEMERNRGILGKIIRKRSWFLLVQTFWKLAYWVSKDLQRPALTLKIVRINQTKCKAGTTTRDTFHFFRASIALALKNTTCTSRNIGQLQVSLVVVPALQFVWFIYTLHWRLVRTSLQKEIRQEEVLTHYLSVAWSPAFRSFYRSWRVCKNLGNDRVGKWFLFF